MKTCLMAGSVDLERSPKQSGLVGTVRKCIN